MSDEIAIFRRFGILKSLDNNILKQGFLHTNKFAAGKLLVPREGSPGGGNGRGLRGPDGGTCETFPWGPLFTEWSCL